LWKDKTRGASTVAAVRPRDYLVERLGQIRFLLIPSCHFPLLTAKALWAFFLILFIFFNILYSSTQAQSKGRRPLLPEQALHILHLLFSLFLSPALLARLQLLATRHSFALYSPSNASSIISPMAFPRFRLEPSRSGLRSTRTTQLLDGDGLPSSARRTTAHSTRGHYDGAGY
jgi:hypothetical protein